MKKLLLLLPLFTLFSCVNDDDNGFEKPKGIGYLELTYQRLNYFDNGGLLRYSYEVKNYADIDLDFRVQFKVVGLKKDTLTYTTDVKTSKPNHLNHYYQFFVAPKDNYRIISFDIKK